MKIYSQISVLIFALSLLFGLQESKAQESDYTKSPKNWVKTRLDNAKNGKKEIIQSPFAVRSIGWGCKCPDYYLGESTTVAEGPWVLPVYPQKLPKKNKEGHALLVKGYFTGRVINIDLRNENKEPKEWLYKVPEFKIISWQYNKEEWQGLIPKIVE